MRAAVFGASGGIGRAFATCLSERRPGIDLYLGSRDTASLTGLPGTHFAFDLTSEASIADASIVIGGPLDLVFVATGVLKKEGKFEPEKSWKTLDASAMADVYALNTVGPALIGKHFLPLLARDRRSVFAVLSARVGSISDNRLGGWHSYRASKAALNMIVRNFALELAVRNKVAISISLHPGTVDTALSRPFQRRVKDDKLFAPDYSAERLLAVLNSLTPADSGKMFAWDGAEIAF